MPPLEPFVQDEKSLRKRFTGEAAGNSDGNQRKEYTWEEVAEHNSEKSAWCIVKDRVYDITEWIPRHPGGKQVLRIAAGKDLTDAIDSYHPFTDKPWKVLEKYDIGKAKTTEFPQFKEDNGLYEELREKVGKYFADKKINPKDPLPGTWRLALILISAAVTWSVAYNPSIWPACPIVLRAIAAAAFGICQALPLLHVMHDCSHTSYGNVSKMWEFMGRFCMDFYAGANFTTWYYQHTVGHHLYTNIFQADPDLPAKEVDDFRRLSEKQVASFANPFALAVRERQVLTQKYKYQYIYLPILYGLLGMAYRVQDFTETFFRYEGALIAHFGSLTAQSSKSSNTIRVNPLGVLDWGELVLSKLAFVFWRVYVPLYVFGMNPTTFWILFVISDFATGYHLAFNFQVSHVSTACDFPLPDIKSGKFDMTWAESQIKGSVDYSHHRPLTTFMCGALNYQIAHHLFPSVSQYHYPALAPIMIDTCKKYDVEYRVLPDFWTAFKSHLMHLKVMGERGEKAELHMG